VWVSTSKHQEQTIGNGMERDILKVVAANLTLIILKSDPSESLVQTAVDSFWYSSFQPSFLEKMGEQ
jgi:hypothetical protein